MPPTRLPELIYVVEDEMAIARIIGDTLEKFGYRHEVFRTAEALFHGLRHRAPDLVILDLGLPDMDGMTVLQQMRGKHSCGLLIVTGRSDTHDRVMGLELGADDYVPKPCTPRELSARLRAILRRSLPKPTGDKSAEADSIRIGELALLPAQRRITWSEQTLALTNAEFNLLEVLIQKAGQVVSKDLLSEQGLGRPHERYDRSIDVHVSSIRRKLPPLPDGRPRIQAVFRRGYQLLVD